MIRLISAVVLALGVSSQALAMNKEYFQIKKVTVREVTDVYPAMDVFAAKKSGLLEDCSTGMPLDVKKGQAAPKADASPLGAIEVFVDQIINIGKKIWAIVDAGRPVVNIKLDTANALPKGLTCWSDLSGWQAPQSKVYNVQYENALGMIVVDYSYRVTFTAGGSADGVGKYITNATFMPANVEVGWGFDLSADAQIPSVFNTNTKADPVAGMQMNMKWQVKSPITHAVATESYFVSGQNTLTVLE